MTRVATIPTLDVDLFDDEALTDPYPHYRRIQELGPVVHLPAQDVYAVTRFQDARAVLRNWEVFSSAGGVAFNPTFNALGADTVLFSDPPQHEAVRSVLLDRLRLRSVRDLVPGIEAKAHAHVRELAAAGTFDAVTDLARRFPPMVVGELIGFSPDLLDDFVDASEAVFSLFGPQNRRFDEALPKVVESLGFMAGLTAADLAPGSIGRALYEAAERGDIPQEFCPKLLWTYTGPGFYSTICAIGNAIWLLATHPDQWRALKADPGLVTGACNEAMRLEGPFQIVGRYCRTDFELDGSTIPAGSRVALILGAANRDPRRYPEPERFDIRRDPHDHLGFGNGIHICVGAALARMELESVIKAVAADLDTLEPGPTSRRLNNVIRGFASLPLTVS